MWAGPILEKPGWRTACCKGLCSDSFKGLATLSPSATSRVFSCLDEVQYLWKGRVNTLWHAPSNDLFGLRLLCLL